MATHTHPGPWWDEDLATVITVMDILNEKAAAITAAAKGG